MDAVSGIFRGTLWNETIPDRLRGRLAGIEMISWSSGPALGNVRAGAVGAYAGARLSVISGGLLCVAGSVALALALPRFWRYDARDAAAAAPAEPIPAA
jgi:MFS family permease